MDLKQGQGNFINGSFINEGSITLTSKNPSCNNEPVITVHTDPSHVSLAIDAARLAHKSWGKLPADHKISALLELKQAFIRNESTMATAISSEMGKIMSEALTEAKSLSARIDLMIEHGLRRVKTESFYEHRALTRHHHQGVLAVIGPYNFPAHLVNAHVIPSVLLGNTVVIKPSELCPGVASVYAQCVKESRLPDGVINIVNGDGAIGRALCSSKNIEGILFTGSYNTGRALKEMLLDEPHKILALEMGGKNFAVIMDDADLKQAALEVVMGGFLTTGQRCTATSRVLVHDRVFEKFRNLLTTLVQSLAPVKATEVGMFGPMASQNALNRFMAGLKKAHLEGVEVLVESRELPGGAFVTPSLYQIRKNHPMAAYLSEELFGPNLALENFSSFDEAIARINESPYGLSNSIFSLDPKNSERMLQETRSGVLNINRSTNNALGQMPFGGVNKSGNQRPAGIDAVRYATFPVAITSIAYGESSAPKDLKAQISAVVTDETSLATIVLRHDIEALFEIYGIYSDAAALDRVCYNRTSFDGLRAADSPFFTDLAATMPQAVIFEGAYITIILSAISHPQQSLSALSKLLQTYASKASLSLKRSKALSINIPPNLEIPRSRAMLDRLYRGNFIPAEKKALVADLERSRGAYLTSVDDNPLTIIDAASQIATLGAGFLADTFQNAYDTHELDYALLANVDLSLPNNDQNSPIYRDALEARTDFEEFLTTKSGGHFTSISYGAGGSEANEIAFDLSRRNGPGGTRIVAFQGSFHGRTIMSLQATYNKEKRGPFSFKGFEATFLPFPELKNPNNQPDIPLDLLAVFAQGQIPPSSGNDPLFAQELASLSALKAEVESHKICAVIIEPMQCEGGDKYASNRFFCCLRALTRGLKIPLIFDEVQTGFNLGREFFWFQQLNLVDQHGKPEFPDCITLAKKAQLGVCLSVWPNSSDYSPHVIQLKRGLLHASCIDKQHAQRSESKALKELLRLQEYFPALVQNPRACGFAFAFDMPTKELANELIDQRFMYGFMAYIAGEKTLRFRLNMVTTDEVVERLFERLFIALIDIRDQQVTERIAKRPTSTFVEKIGIENFALLSLTDANFSQYAADINRIEENAYEPGRRDTADYLHSWLKGPDAIGIAALGVIDGKQTLLGYAIGGPLEFSTVDGAKHDKNRNKANTFYSTNITIDDRVRGLGIGSLLKAEQIRIVSSLRKKDHTPRYQFIAGRNRVGATPAMTQINDNVGAYVVSVYDNQYNEVGAKATYYRLPIQKAHHNVEQPVKSKTLDCQNTIQTPFANIPTTFLDAVKANKLRSLAGSKLTLSNWATPNLVRYSELLRAVMPRHLKHAYFTSGRDEVLDKGLRSLRFHRPDADIAIGLSHQWLGRTTAAARSLSHADHEAAPFAFFNWPKVAHPGLAGTKNSVDEIKKIIAAKSPSQILGIVVELLGERSGLTISEDFLVELDTIRKTSGIPLVFVETASSLGRNGKTSFLTDSLTVKPNMVLWYSGGQLGNIFVDDNYFVEKPLTLISTWDGDEISIARAYHNLLAMENYDLGTINYFDQAIRALDTKATRVGMGAWHAIRFNDESTLTRAIEVGRSHGILFGRGFDHSLMVCPKADFTRDEFMHVLDVVKKVV